MQRRATEKAVKILNAEAILLEYADGEIPLNDAAALAVCDLVRQLRPEVVVTHWRGGWHKDHQNCHGIVRDAIFYAGLKAMARKQPAHTVSPPFFAENWEDMASFQADIFLGIGPVHARWLEACAQLPMWQGETGFRYSDY